MKHFAYLLVVASVATGQLIGSSPLDAAPAGDLGLSPDAAPAGLDATASAGPAPGGADPALAGAPAGAGAGQAAGGAQAPTVVIPNPQHNFGPSFFGPGLNNPRALPANPFMTQQAKLVVSQLPNVRVFVDVDGTIRFTDEYGRDVEVVNELGVDIIEKAEEMAEMQAQLAMAQRQAEFSRRSQLFQNQLRLELGLQHGGGLGEGAFGEAALGDAQAFANIAPGGGAAPGLHNVAPLFRVVRN
ncbi:uncharacterized protein LOC143021504 [Oratosquilla oratoria]|uniref:uncharacterized protein LOC143021504 n=1 Tax=Oratosquilla oratoria TaxID=337810 RepID=UPI003F757220